MTGRTEEFGTGQGQKPPFKRKVSPGVLNEMKYDLENGSVDDADQGYTIKGSHVHVHDHVSALSAFTNRQDILEDEHQTMGDNGAGSKARAYQRIVNEIRAHYGTRR